MRCFWHLLAILSLVAFADPASADPCLYPWSADYHAQPGPWQLAVGGTTMDAGFVYSSQLVVLLGEDDLGPWLRTYRLQSPSTLTMMDERRDLVAPTAIEVRSPYCYLLDDGELRVLVVGGSGELLSQVEVPLDGSPRLLAVRDDLLWAGGGAVMSQLSIEDPGAPQLLRTAAATVTNGELLRAHGESAWTIAPGDNIERFYVFNDDLRTISSWPSFVGSVMDIGW